MSFWPSRWFSIVCLRMNIASKLAFMNIHALSQPSVNHLLPYFECVCEQFDASVILTLLNVTLFFENGDQNAVSPGRWYALSGHDSVEKFAKCHHSELSQAFPYLHTFYVIIIFVTHALCDTVRINDYVICTTHPHMRTHAITHTDNHLTSPVQNLQAHIEDDIKMIFRCKQWYLQVHLLIPHILPT